MNAENVLKYALNLRGVLDPDNKHLRPTDLETLKAAERMIPNDPHTLISLIIAECKATETPPAKKTRKSKAHKTAEAILQATDPPRPESWRYPQIHNGVQYFSDSVVVVKLTTPLPLEEMPADLAAVVMLDLDARYSNLAAECTNPIKIPSASDLAEIIKAHNNAEVVVYDFPCGFSVNVRYLLNALEVLNAKNVQTFVDARNHHICIQTPNGSGAVVCGRRTRETTSAQ